MSIIISFDGLNRSGKGTQIEMLHNYFKTVERPVEVLRGDGSRPGIGSLTFYDPKSQWWTEWQANINKSYNDWNRAYHVLSEENVQRDTEFSNENPKGVILMDRSYVSRYFMLKQQMVETSLEKVLEGTRLRPNRYFILNVPQNVLLERFSDDNPLKKEFRKDVVKKWYDLWTKVIVEVQEFLKNELTIIDGTQSPEVIHTYVKSNL